MRRPPALRTILLAATAAVAASGLASCGAEDATPREPRRAKPVVYATFHPTAYLAGRLAEGDADVVLPLPEGEDPATSRPDAETVRAYQRADLVVLNGAGLESWVLHSSLAPSRLLDTSRPFRGRWLRHERTVEHRHGPEGEHAHEGTDAHVWLDPVLAKEQARGIATALERLLPERVEAIRRRRAALEADLDDLDARFAQAARAAPGATLFASHPAYGYLARRYGLRIVDLALDPATPPSEASLAEVRERLRTTPARFLLWESEPAPAVAEAFRATGLTGVVVSPAENPSPAELAAGGDYLAQMRRNAETLSRALAASAGR